jgi:hypothetical protein
VLESRWRREPLRALRRGRRRKLPPAAAGAPSPSDPLPRLP